jgi:hypothetical protein
MSRVVLIIVHEYKEGWFLGNERCRSYCCQMVNWSPGFYSVPLLFAIKFTLNFFILNRQCHQNHVGSKTYKTKPFYNFSNLR